jgi:hypothetical protein
MKENTNNYFIFASDKRSYLDTINVVKELKKRNINYFYLFSKHIQTQNPSDLTNFNYDTNVDLNKSILYSSINCSLPFKPDVVILTRESWQPQQSIITEFKQKGSIITCIENATWIIGTIKSRMEMISRYRYPTNCIDMFFEHSSWSLETKKVCGWYDFKSKIVGNPKYDNIDSKSQEGNGILVFGTMENEAKIKVYEILEKLKTTNRKIYYRPHPGEIESNPNINIEGIQIIFNESEIPEIASKCEFHLANMGASAYYSVLFNKTFIALDQNIGRTEDLNIDFFKNNPHEYSFWAPIMGVNSWEEFVNKIDLNRVEKLKNRFEEVKESLLFYDDKLEFLNKPPSKIFSFYNFFDDFNDQNASERIIDEIEKTLG